MNNLEQQQIWPVKMFKHPNQCFDYVDVRGGVIDCSLFFSHMCEGITFSLVILSLKNKQLVALLIVSCFMCVPMFVCAQVLSPWCHGFSFKLNISDWFYSVSLSCL